jgi:hypothetical protein
MKEKWSGEIPGWDNLSKEQQEKISNGPRSLKDKDFDMSDLPTKEEHDIMSRLYESDSDDIRKYKKLKIGHEGIKDFNNNPNLMRQYLRKKKKSTKPKRKTKKCKCKK